MKPQCKHCKWWDELELGEAATDEGWPGAGDCKRMWEPDAPVKTFGWGGKNSNRVTHLEGIETMITRPDFGCSEFEIDNLDIAP